MENVDMNVFRGLAIILLTIIAFMVIDSFFNVPFLTFILSAMSGTLIGITCRGIKKNNLNTFRATLGIGLVFLIFGNYILFTNLNKYYYDSMAAYIVTIGYFLSAIGVIIMFSSIPLIIIKDLEEHRKRILLNSQRFG